MADSEVYGNTAVRTHRPYIPHAASQFGNIKCSKATGDSRSEGKTEGKPVGEAEGEAKCEAGCEIEATPRFMLRLRLSRGDQVRR